MRRRVAVAVVRRRPGGGDRAGARLEQTIAAVKLHLVTEIGSRGIPVTELSRDTAAWLRSRLVLDTAAARQLIEQAAALRRHPAVDAALCAGRIHLRQAAAICDSLDALPSIAELAAARRPRRR